MEKNLSKFNCEPCNFESYRKDAYHKHLLSTKHQTKCCGLVKTPNEKFIFNCEDCDYTTKRTDNLKRHIELKHKISKYECNYCNRQFRGDDNIQEHIKSENHQTKIIYLLSKTRGKIGRLQQKFYSEEFISGTKFTYSDFLSRFNDSDKTKYEMLHKKLFEQGKDLKLSRSENEENIIQNQIKEEKKHPKINLKKKQKMKKDSILDNYSMESLSQIKIDPKDGYTVLNNIAYGGRDEPLVKDEDIDDLIEALIKYLPIESYLDNDPCHDDTVNDFEKGVLMKHCKLEFIAMMAYTILDKSPDN